MFEATSSPDRQQSKCQGNKGGNACNRKPDFIIEDLVSGEIFESCADCVGRILVEHDADESIINRVF